MKVDNNLPQHTSTLVRSRFIKIIRNFSVDVEISTPSLKDPLISLPIYKGLYKGNFESVYLYRYLVDLNSD